MLISTIRVFRCDSEIFPPSTDDSFAKVNRCRRRIFKIVIKYLSSSGGLLSAPLLINWLFLGGSEGFYSSSLSRVDSSCFHIGLEALGKAGEDVAREAAGACTGWRSLIFDGKLNTFKKEVIRCIYFITDDYITTFFTYIFLQSNNRD